MNLNTVLIFNFFLFAVRLHLIHSNARIKQINGEHVLVLIINTNAAFFAACVYIKPTA